MAYQHRPGGLPRPILRIQPGDGLLGVVECLDMVRVGEGEAGEGDVMECNDPLKSCSGHNEWRSQT